MASELTEEFKKKIYQTMITYPTKTDTQISNETGLSRGRVYRLRKKLIIAIDCQLGAKVAGRFLTEFQMASDYFKLQIERLEELKLRQKTIFKKGTNGNSYAEQVDLGPLDILAIEKQQTELWKNILEFARQGEAVEVMRLMQNGKIQPLTN